MFSKILLNIIRFVDLDLVFTEEYLCGEMDIITTRKPSKFYNSLSEGRLT